MKCAAIFIPIPAVCFVWFCLVLPFLLLRNEWKEFMSFAEEVKKTEKVCAMVSVRPCVYGRASSEHSLVFDK